MNNRDSLLAEYKAAHDSFHHYDTFRWRSGSLLIASSLVIWGFLLSDSPKPKTIGITSLFISSVLASWIFYAHHYRQLYMTKLFRIQQIEYELNMELNIKHGFLDLTDKFYKIYGFKGHHIDLFLYVIISLFGPILTSFEKSFSPWLFLSFPVILISLMRVSINEKRMKKFYESNIELLKPSDNKNSPPIVQEH